jgi:hypothetical protein
VYEFNPLALHGMSDIAPRAAKSSSRYDAGVLPAGKLAKMRGSAMFGLSGLSAYGVIAR